MSASATQGGHNNSGADPIVRERGFVSESGDGSHPAESRGKAPVGGRGTSTPEAGGILQIILHCVIWKKAKT